MRLKREKFSIFHLDDLIGLTKNLFGPSFLRELNHRCESISCKNKTVGKPLKQRFKNFNIFTYYLTILIPYLNKKWNSLSRLPSEYRNRFELVLVWLLLVVALYSTFYSERHVQTPYKFHKVYSQKHLAFRAWSIFKSYNWTELELLKNKI